MTKASSILANLQDDILRFEMMINMTNSLLRKIGEDYYGKKKMELKVAEVARNAMLEMGCEDTPKDNNAMLKHIKTQLAKGEII